MKKIITLLVCALAPLAITAQNVFDTFENERDVTAVVVTKNMFKLMSKMDLDSKDPEAKQYLDMVNNLSEIKIFTTENKDIAARMNTTFTNYITGSNKLTELMRVKDGGNNIKFYAKEGSNENFVSELLMFMDGTLDDKPTTVVMSITGNIDLKQIGKLTEQLNVPGSTQLKNVKKQ